MDHSYIVYKIDNPIQSSLLSSLVINPIQGFTFDYNTYILSHTILVINIYFHYIFDKFLFIEETVYIPHINRSFYIFNLNPYFLTNSKLINNPITLLSNSTSTIILSCILILSSLIFTLNFLNIFSLSRLQQDILSINRAQSRTTRLSFSLKLFQLLLLFLYLILFSCSIISCQISKIPQL